MEDNNGNGTNADNSQAKSPQNFVTPSAPDVIAPSQSAPMTPASPSAPVPNTPQVPDTSQFFQSSKPQQPAEGQPSYMPSQPQATMPPKGKKGKKALLLVLVVGLLVLLGGSAGAYFGLIVPNKPENVWNKALTNTGQAYDKISEYATTQSKNENGSKVDATYSVTQGEMIYDGSIQSVNDAKNSKTTLDIGAMGTRVKAEVLTTIPETSTYPDIYAKVTGLSSIGELGGPELASLLGQVENQWYVVDHTLFDQLAASTEQEATETLSQEDITAISDTIGRVSKDYIFTDDAEKSVLQVAEFVGKEDMNGAKAYHYKVTANKTNLKAYLTTLRDELKKTKLGELYGEAFENSGAFDEMIASVDELKEDETADVWVDARTKLIQTVRFSDKDNPSNFFDIGQTYNGGDTYPFFFKIRGAEDGGTYVFDLNIDVNSKSNEMKITGKLDVDDETTPINGELSATVTPNREPIELTLPEGAKSYTELVQLFYGGATLGESTNEPSLPFFTDLQDQFETL